MTFCNKLINLFYKTATGSKKIRNFLTPIGAILFFSFIGLFIILSLWTDKLLHFSKLISYPLNAIISFFILSMGICLMLWSISDFIKVKGTPIPFNPPPKLVTTGPYSYIRNPMLSSVFILFNFFELKTIEEPELEKRLGKDYSKYKKVSRCFSQDLRKNKKGNQMSTFILMKILESVPSKYEQGIRSLTPGNLDIGHIIPPPILSESLN